MEAETMGYASIRNPAGLLLLFLFTNAYAQLQPLAKPAALDVMEKISAGTQGNFGRLRTWKGEMIVRERAYLRGPRADSLLGVLDLDPEKFSQGITTEHNIKVLFVCDLEHDMLFSSSTQQKPKILNTGDDSAVVSRRVAPADFTQLVKPDEYVCLTGNLLDSAENVRVARVLSKDRMKNEPAYGSLYDPRELFAPGRTRMVWGVVDSLRGNPTALLERSVSTAAELRFWVEHIRENPDAYRIVTISNVAGASNRQEVTCDEVFGLNWARMEEWRDGRQSYLSEVEYTSIEGVFVPRNFSFTTWDRDGNKAMERTIAIQSSTINGELAPSQFTLNALKLQEGELVRDEIRGTDFVMTAGQLRPTTRPGL
jgi:hypothetical protein